MVALPPVVTEKEREHNLRCGNANCYASCEDACEKEVADFSVSPPSCARAGSVPIGGVTPTPQSNEAHAYHPMNRVDGSEFVFAPAVWVEESQ